MPNNDLKTIKVVLSPDSENTSLTLWYYILMNMDPTSEIKVKEKAYGLLIKGPKHAVDRIASVARKIDSCGIFIIESAPRIKGYMIFRGFLQLSGELRSLPLISQVLKNPDGNGVGEPKVSGKLIRCRYIGRGPVDALLLDYGGGKIQVRCPDMILHGCHVCGSSCPYGEIRSP